MVSSTVSDEHVEDIVENLGWEDDISFISEKDGWFGRSYTVWYKVRMLERNELYEALYSPIGSDGTFVRTTAFSPDGLVDVLNRRSSEVLFNDVGRFERPLSDASYTHRQPTPQIYSFTGVGESSGKVFFVEGRDSQQASERLEHQDIHANCIGTMDDLGDALLSEELCPGSLYSTSSGFSSYSLTLDHSQTSSQRDSTIEQRSQYHRPKHDQTNEYD